MKACVVEVGSAGAVLIKAGETIPEWMQFALEDAYVTVTNPLSSDLLYPMTPSVGNEGKSWDVDADGSFEAFDVGEDPSAFLEG